MAWTISALFAAPFAIAAEMTLNRYCPILERTMKNYDEDSEAFQELQRDVNAHCKRADGDVGYSKTLAELGISQNRWIDRTRQVQTTGEAAESAEDAIRDAGTDRNDLYHQCKMVCAQSESNCRGALANARDQADQDYRRINGLTGGNEASVNQACNSIPSFQSSSNELANRADQACQEYLRPCRDVCARADAAAPVAGRSDNWVQINRQAGEASASSIPGHVRSARDLFTSNVQALQNSCNNARAALQQKAADNKQAKEDQKKQDSTNQALGNALQSLGSALGSQTPPPAIPPIGMDLNQGSYQMPETYGSPSASSMGSAVKNTDGFNSKVNTSGDPLMLGDTPADMSNYQRSKLGRMAQQAGGGGAGLGGGGGGGGAGKQNARRGGGRSRFDPDVLKGAQGGNGSAGTRGGNGYPDEMNGGTGAGRGRGGPGGLAAGANPNMVSLQKFLPGRMQIRRDVANTVGPDGITGPHTDLFKKVRTRYNDVILDNGF